MAADGMYVERGIAGAHGYMAEYFTSPAEFLVDLDSAFAPYGFLVEPLSNAVKAKEHADASRSAFTWTPESALVLGNGPLGLLTLAMLVPEFDRAYCLGRRDRPDPTIDVIERLGATYIDSRETPIQSISEAHEDVDLAVEATGYARHAFEVVDALAPNGVAALLGIPEDWTFDLEGGRLHRDLVLHNKAIVGSVNSSIPHFETARERLAAFPDWFPEALITGVFSPEDAAAAFEADEETLKAVVEFDAP
jgi:threonine dehydrogenase-like Zn-dependent dehydrogenase